eukprot:7377592-Prymnesium_polylepis.1
MQGGGHAIHECPWKILKRDGLCPERRPFPPDSGSSKHGDIAGRRVAEAEAREGKLGVEGVLDTVHLRRAFDRPLCLGASGDDATDSLAGASREAVVEHLV